MSESFTVVKNVQLAFVNVAEPTAVGENSALRFRTSVLINKEDEENLKAIKEAINAAIEKGKTKFGSKFTTGKCTMPIHDGNEKEDTEGFKDKFYFNAASKNAPKLFDRRAEPMLDRNGIYSGCYANVIVNFYPYMVPGNKGIAAGLGDIQFISEGERFGGGLSGSAAFKNEDENFSDGIDISEGGFDFAE